MATFVFLAQLRNAIWGEGLSFPMLRAFRLDVFQTIATQMTNAAMAILVTELRVARTEFVMLELRLLAARQADAKPL